ncbi:potassium transporter TrkH [Alphaproteobacteria bacterium]|nr:potassium transporter TrkH [Alphaproteobacteria bacterium]MDB9825037.1 potassium transporter TrkH [Alphaproteobacteria bacterium]
MFDFKPISLVLGFLICATGFFLCIPLVTEIIYKTDQWQAYAVPLIVYLVVGGSLIIINKDTQMKLNLKGAFFLTGISWITMALICSIPFMFAKTNLTFVDAIFESMSGITTTGSTIINDLDLQPKGVLIWRALLQWLGGIGIIVLAISVLPFLKVGGMQLFHMEGDDPYEKFLPRITSVISKIFFIYIGLTITCIITYFYFGMSVFDAITHGFTTISTGGFSTHNESMAFFNSNKILLTSIVFMIVGSFPFILIAQVSLKNPFVLFKDQQIRLFILMIIGLVISIYFMVGNGIINTMGNKIITITFNSVSIITGTGYVSDNFENWGNYSSILFLLIMFIGGCAGSTTGGIKIFRFQILFLSVKNHIKKLIKPHGVFASKFNGNSVTETTFDSVTSFFYLYMLSFVIISILLSFSGYDLVTCISAAATAISNVGPGLGEIIGPEGNFSLLSDYSKLILSLGMLFGRLEILTLLILLSPFYWKN